MNNKKQITVYPFVNGNYKTHAQYVETYMVHKGLRFDKIEPSGHSIVEAYEAAKKYRNDVKQLKLKNDNKGNYE